jgi:hypothetical protein
VRKLDDERFPSEPSAFAFLQPMHMQTFDAQQRICRLAARYQLDTERVLSQWRLARQQFKAAAAAAEQQPATATVS